ncbi:MAG TPA: DUF2520 domain-containing protein [Bacteroidales bacterium]|nr:DUF2520 domain-containing protein [Bacteroidales bacterium]HOK97823.1 DUF2520 domain-containing protein [Bacteroidales bacterium]HPO64561.1 DUF2520 domain-containing protein [Bacteroidales bacterium]
MMRLATDNFRTMVVLGSGNVATHLARAFSQRQIKIVQIYSRTLDHARRLADEISCLYTNQLNSLVEADLYLFALSDSAILEVLQQGEWNDKLCVHTAGSVPMDVFKPFTQAYGVIYPFQTFSRDVEIDFNQVPFFIEASNKTVEDMLSQLIGRVSSTVQYASSQQRLHLHLAGVFACNFVNHMLAIAEQILLQKNIPLESLHPLVQETFRKALAISAHKAQTGPAVRNNVEVIQKHIDLLKEKPEWQKIYTFVSESIYKMYHS